MMINQKIHIIPFAAHHQRRVDLLMDSLVAEFPFEFITPVAKKMEELCMLPGRYYWVAMADDKVIGTAGIIIQDGYAVLKSMFLDKDYRGREYQIAFKLLQTAINKANEAHISIMYLGTMAEFTAARRFYKKHGFSRVDASALPAQFPANEVDDVFFKMKIINNE